MTETETRDIGKAMTDHSQDAGPKIGLDYCEARLLSPCRHGLHNDNKRGILSCMDGSNAMDANKITENSMLAAMEPFCLGTQVPYMSSRYSLMTFSVKS